MNVKEEFLKFQGWLLEHKADYKSILAEKPYCIEVKEDVVDGRGLALFKYSQIDSDFGQPFIKLCRGLVLDAATFEPVVFPFVKFHNAGEPHADDIDWSSCSVTEKLDGSIIKIVRFNGRLLIGTNANIDAFKASLTPQHGCTAATFGDLVDEALVNAYRENNIGGCTAVGAEKWLYDMLEDGVTYIFELTSPFNRVVVKWNDTRLNFLGCRDNSTLKETMFNAHPLCESFNTPKVFPLTNLSECVTAAEKLTIDSEGYVVVDSEFNRVKVKSPLYVAVHHMRGENGVLSNRRAYEIVKMNEADEVLTYFPEYGEAINDVKNRLSTKIAEFESCWFEFSKVRGSMETRKEMALWIISHCSAPGMMFSMLDSKIPSFREGIMEMPVDSVLKMIGLKEV